MIARNLETRIVKLKVSRRRPDELLLFWSRPNGDVRAAASEAKFAPGDRVICLDWSVTVRCRFCCTCYSELRHEAIEHRDPTIEIGSDILSGGTGNSLLGYERLSSDDGRGNRERHSSAQS